MTVRNKGGKGNEQFVTAQRVKAGEGEGEVKREQDKEEWEGVSL